MGESLQSSSIAAMPACGDVIAGKYRITSVIGEGGMGTVFAAHHEMLDVAVAVKVLSAGLVQTSGAVDRFTREARAVARLRSEHVAHVMDVGTLDGGQPYIVMELLQGEDLRQRLEREGQLPVQQAVDYVMQALDAVAHAHAAGIIHRDLKPENLFVTITPDGREIVKVLDFGIAKLTQATQPAESGRWRALTAEHAALGSPHYMAPEQVRDSRQIDQRADVWALGVILYELVTGRDAFPGTSSGEIFASILKVAPAPIEALRPDAPWELDAVVSSCLARDPDERFANVAELARALAPLSSDAWSLHADRVEQTLMRSQRLSDPMLGPPDSGIISVRPMRARYSSVPTAASESSKDAAVQVVVAPLDRNLISKPVSTSRASTPPPLLTSVPSWRPALVLTAAAMALVAVFVAVHATTPRRADVHIGAPLSSGLPAHVPQPPRTVSVGPAAPTPRSDSQLPPPAWVAPASSDSTPVAAVRRGKSPSLPRPASSPKGKASASPALPSVLSSPE
jgi:serine/threonine-protein kinase